MSSGQETRGRCKEPGKQVLKVVEDRELVVHLSSPVPYRKDLASDIVSFAEGGIRELEAQVKACFSPRGWPQAPRSTWTDPAQPHWGQSVLQTGRSWALEAH